jgi:farnesyl diphosphate synthase
VKVVFNELKLDQAYYEYEDKVVGELKKKIAAVDESMGFKAEVLNVFLNKIYKRSKWDLILWRLIEYLLSRGI